jgi:hypothetical protein
VSTQSKQPPSQTCAANVHRLSSRRRRYTQTRCTRVQYKMPMCGWCSSIMLGWRSRCSAFLSVSGFALVSLFLWPFVHRGRSSRDHPPPIRIYSALQNLSTTSLSDHLAVANSSSLSDFSFLSAAHHAADFTARSSGCISAAYGSCTTHLCSTSSRSTSDRHFSHVLAGWAATQCGLVDRFSIPAKQIHIRMHGFGLVKDQQQRRTASLCTDIRLGFERPSVSLRTLHLCLRLRGLAFA